MKFSFDFFRRRQIVFVNEHSFGLIHTHFAKKEVALSLCWDEIRAIDAMKLASSNPGLVFKTNHNAQEFISQRTESWKLLEQAIHQHFPNFDWQALDKAKQNEYDLSLRFPCWRQTAEIEKTSIATPMRSSTDLFREHQIISVNEDSFGIVYTHWLQKRRSWSLRWEDVLAIEATQSEPADMGFIFINTKKKWRMAAEDMQNWSALEQAIRQRYPTFNWENFELARSYIDARIPCWTKPL